MEIITFIQFLYTFKGLFRAFEYFTDEWLVAAGTETIQLVKKENGRLQLLGLFENSTEICLTFTKPFTCNVISFAVYEMDGFPHELFYFSPNRLGQASFPCIAKKLLKIVEKLNDLKLEFPTIIKVVFTCSRRAIKENSLMKQRICILTISN